MTDLQYIYQKERKEFGKQCLFSDKKFLMVSLPSNHDEFNDYILRNPVSEGTQLSRQFALSEVNTMSTTTESRGILHTEGGWPKDVNYLDSEQTLRYRRKLEKDETYISQVPRMGEVRTGSSKSRILIFSHAFCLPSVTASGVLHPAKQRCKYLRRIFRWLGASTDSRSKPLTHDVCLQGRRDGHGNGNFPSRSFYI